MNQFHNKMMGIALSLARQAGRMNEVPVGAVITRDELIVGVGYNLRESENRAVAHAELLAIESANRNLGHWRLNKCTLYVTLEPCVMCAGAIQQSRISQVIYGAHDPKGGAYGSLYSINEDHRLNHIPEFVEAGLRAEESSLLLKSFFSAKRKST
jgi:tRNA(adenine34) deaminase